VRNPQGCTEQAKSVCLWAEGTYNAGNGVVYALTEDEAFRPCPFLWHWRMAIARSVDNGVTFDDLGIVLDEPGPEICDTTNDYLSGGVGDGNWVIPGDGYAYVVYSVYGGTWSPTGGSQGLGVARIRLTDLADPVSMDPVTGAPNGPSRLLKWHAVRDLDGIWKVPDADGNPTATRCTDANDCFNADGITGETTPIPGSHPRYDNLSVRVSDGPVPTDLWYFPTSSFVRRGSDQVTVIMASHISQTGGWYDQADFVGAWLGDIAHPETFRGPTVALLPCFGELDPATGAPAIGAYLTLFGDRADTFDTPAAVTGENADGAPRPIPLFGLTHDHMRPRSRWTFTFCKPGETSGVCGVGPGASSFAVGSDISCPG
jgi:hypothetical protein